MQHPISSQSRFTMNALDPIVGLSTCSSWLRNSHNLISGRYTWVVIEPQSHFRSSLKRTCSKLKEKMGWFWLMVICHYYFVLQIPFLDLISFLERWVSHLVRINIIVKWVLFFRSSSIDWIEITYHEINVTRLNLFLLFFFLCVDNGQTR